LLWTSCIYSQDKILACDAKAVLANFTVYGPSGAKDIKKYRGFTMSSDYKRFGAIANGEYTVNYCTDGKKGALSSHWAINNKGPVDCLFGKNPSPLSPYSSTQKNAVYYFPSL
jgi:hypothetical protein